MPEGRVPSFGNAFVPVVCDETAWLAADAGAPALPAGVPPGGGLSALGGCDTLALPVARVEFVRSVLCAAVDEFVIPEGATGNGADAPPLVVVVGVAGACTVLPLERADSAPGALSRWQATSASAASIAAAVPARARRAGFRFSFMS